MLFGNDRDSLRQTYKESLRKFDAGEPMSPLETQIAQVINDHPEYRDAIVPSGKHPQDPLDRDYLPEAGEINPFMHMSLHLAVRDQLATNRPAGIRESYAVLCSRLSPHDAEHVLCEQMGQELWQAQRDQRPPDEQRYLRRVKNKMHKKA